MIIDFHNHVWPDSVARRALGGNIPDMELFGDGTVANLREAQDSAGIDRSVCLAVAKSPSQLSSANSFVGSLDRSRFVPFGSIHPLASVEENLHHIRMNNLAGVKLHAVFQGYRLDDPALYETLAALEGEFCVIAHVGEGGGSDGTACTPKMIAAIATTFPRLDLVACHFGGFHRLAEAREALMNVAVMMDTSWPPSLATLDPRIVRETIHRHGVERVLFASDWPTACPAAEIMAIRALGLDEDEMALVLGGNAQRLLGIGDDI